MALKLIPQNATTLLEAFQERKAEYEALRAARRWSGAVLYSGTLLELALKIVICTHLGITKLPTIFQVHDLDLLLYCSGKDGTFENNKTLWTSFLLISKGWSLSLRYEGATKTQHDSDDVDQALFDPSGGVITFLSGHF